MLSKLCFCVVVVSGLVVTACTPARYGRNAMGETTYSFTCYSECHVEAQRACPGGYVIDSLRGNRWTVSCTATSAPLPETTLVDPNDRTAACGAIYRHAKEFAPYWLARSPGAKALDPLPPERDFVSVCKPLPENVQRCMFEQYRRANVKACEATLSRLDEWTRARIDSLLLEAPPVEPATTPAPPSRADTALPPGST